MDITSTSKANGDKDKFSFTLADKNDGLKADLESQSVNTDQATKDKASLTIYFDRLVQYDTGGDYSGGATVGNDYVLGDQKWNDFQCQRKS